MSSSEQKHGLDFDASASDKRPMSSQPMTPGSTAEDLVTDSKLTSSFNRVTSRKLPNSPKFDASTSTASASSRSGKLHVAEPASFSKFFVVLVIYFCKKVLIINSTKLAWFYICCVTVVSLLTDLFRLPPTYFSDKHNVFNQYFVKLGLGWTLMLLLPFVFVTSYILCVGKIKLVYRQLARLVMLWLWWIFMTYCMTTIEGWTGECSKNSGENVSKNLCKHDGGQWRLWLDISGHSFLLVFCILAIAEEALVFEHWSSLSELFRKDDAQLAAKVGVSDLATLKELYSRWTPLARVLLLGLALLQCIWNVMLLSTALYFHNMPDKLCGVLTGVTGWFVIYRVLCNANTVPPPIVLGKKPSFQHLKS